MNMVAFLHLRYNTMRGAILAVLMGSLDIMKIFHHATDIIILPSVRYVDTHVGRK